MLKKLYPRKYLHSAYEIDYQAYYDQGYRGILYDVDNTLVPHNAPIDHKAQALFLQLKKMGFETCLISNNKRPRVEPFAKALDTKFVSKANKPSAVGYQKGMEIMGTDVTNTLFVGDQIFTDVWGANRAGIYSILTEPIHPKEEIQIVLKRYLEKIVLLFYKNKERKKA